MRAKKRSAASQIASLLTHEWQSRVQEGYVPRICACLNQLSDKEVWWRPNAASNSVGNLVLHLTGNVRQWIVSGLGGKPDRRNRDREFSEKGPLSRGMLIRRLRQRTNEASRVLARLSPGDCARAYRIQGYTVTGFAAAASVLTHFAYHAGQIFYVTKMKRAEDLGFTQLPPAPANVQSGKPRHSRAIRT